VSQAHALVGQLAVVLAVVGAAWSIALAVTRRSAGSLFFANLIWVAIAVGAAAVLGAATLIVNGPPHDALHLVYGVLAVGTLPGAAMVASGRPARQQSIVAAIAATVLVILLLRLVQTGAQA
jgi:hypothetical protein